VLHHQKLKKLQRQLKVKWWRCGGGDGVSR